MVIKAEKIDQTGAGAPHLPRNRPWGAPARESGMAFEDLYEAKSFAVPLEVQGE